MSESGWWLISDEDIQRIRKRLNQLQQFSSIDPKHIQDPIMWLDTGLHITDSVPSDFQEDDKHPSVILTAQEQGVLNLLAEAWNAFLKLPEQHPMHCQEFAHSIHAVQRLIMSRPVARALNDARTDDRSD